jgi:hypothetical protein
VFLVLLITLFGGIVYALSCWNCYNLPPSYVLWQTASWLVSWGAAGLAMTVIVKRPQIMEAASTSA